LKVDDVDIETLKERQNRIKSRIKDLKQTIRDRQSELRRVDFQMIGLIYKQKSGKKVFSPGKVTVLKFEDHQEGGGYSDWVEEGRVTVGKGIALYPYTIDVEEYEREIKIDKIKSRSEFADVVGIGIDDWIIVLLETSDEESMPFRTKILVVKFGDFDPFANDKHFAEKPDVVAE